MRAHLAACSCRSRPVAPGRAANILISNRWVGSRNTWRIIRRDSLISHDREFLNQLVGSIIEIAHRRLNRYRGNWDSYVEQRAARGSSSFPPTRTSRKRSRRCNFCRPVRAKATTAVASAEQVEADRSNGEDRGAGLARANRALPFSAAAAQRAPRYYTEGGRARVRRSCCLSRTGLRSGEGTANGVVGPNGAGSRRAQNCWRGCFRPIRRREVGHNVKAVIFSVSSRDAGSEATVLETARDMPNPVSSKPLARSGVVSFRATTLFKTTAVLRGGRRRACTRQAIARSAEPSHDGRADDAFGCRKHRRAGRQRSRSTRAR